MCYDSSSAPEFYTYKTNLSKCSKQYAWNADTSEWDVTSMEGDEVSDDGPLMTHLAAFSNSSTTMVWEVDAENRLIRSAEKTNDYEHPEFSRELEKRYEYNADGHLAKLVDDFLTDSFHTKTETVYTYGSITTGVSNAHVSASMAARLASTAHGSCSTTSLASVWHRARAALRLPPPVCMC